MIPLKRVTADHDFECIGILLGSLLYGIMALTAGCCRNSIRGEERAVVSAVAYAVDKKDNERRAREQGKLKWRLGYACLAP